jgi:hypothetical protein
MMVHPNIYDSPIGKASGANLRRFQGTSWKMFVPLAGISYSRTNISGVRHEFAKYTRIPVTAKDLEMSYGRICHLSSDEFDLTRPLTVSIEIYKDEVLAIVPELELYGEGSTEIEAMDDLESELIDLYAYLKPIPNRKLGKSPREWKRIIISLIQTKRGY